MKHLILRADPINPAEEALSNPFDGTRANDACTTRLLAALASIAGDHTNDKLARQMLRNATAELFDAAARLDRIGKCGGPARGMLEGAQ